MSARVVAIHLNTGSRAPLSPVRRATARHRHGLEGDRKRRPAREVLFMEQEVLDAFGLAPGTVREQITVSGLALGDLAAGSRLTIGAAVFEVGGPCAPCERMTEIRAGLREALEGRRGRFMRVAEEGEFAVGDPIAVLPPVASPAP